MTIFYLIRHGEKINESGDLGLSELGKSQAERTAKHLKNFPIAAIYTSPYTRAKETAQFFSRELSLSIIEESSLKERMNWESKSQSFEEFIQEWEYATHNPEFKPKRGNSVKETSKKMHNIIKIIALNTKNKHVVLVTHGGGNSRLFSNGFR